MADGARTARVIAALTCAALCLAATLTVGPPDPVGAWRFLTAPDATWSAYSLASLLCWSVLVTALALAIRPFMLRRHQRRLLTGAFAIVIAAAGLVLLGAGVAHHLPPGSQMCCSAPRSLVEARQLDDG